MIVLLANFMESEKFLMMPAMTLGIMVPRILSSIMAHLNVEPDIRQGIAMMKYAVNHPQNFKSNDPHIISKRKVFYGFILGFSQATIGILVEIAIILFLSSLDSLLAIIMKFVALGAIVKFDDMYASALHSEKIKKCVGKALPTEYKRYMGPLYLVNEQKIKEEDSLEAAAKYGKKNPRDEQYFLMFLRFIHKLIRMLYVCWIYYFMPFICIIITFIMDELLKKKVKV